MAGRPRRNVEFGSVRRVRFTPHASRSRGVDAGRGSGRSRPFEALWALLRALERERELVECFAASRIEPDAALLASCRSGLEDALDRQEERSWIRRIANVFLPAGGLAPRPAWSAALLVLVGFSVGILGPRFLQRPAVASGDSDVAVSSDATGSSNFVPQFPSGGAAPIDMHSAQVAGINVMPSGGGQPPSGIADARTATLPRAGHGQ